MSMLNKATLAIVAGATALTAAAPAEAQRWRHRNNDGAVIAAGIAGLAVGAAVASAGRNRYYDRGYYYGPRYGYYNRGYRGYYGPRNYYGPPPRFRGYDRWERRAERRAYRRGYRDAYRGRW